MTDKEVKQRIQSAMEKTLSGLECDSALTQRVLNRAKEGKAEQIVVKKLSGGLILALGLALLLVTAALALTNWDQLRGYFETVRTMDAEGELARWSDEDKIKLAKAMVDAGIVSSEEERAGIVLNESLTVKVRSEAANALVTERYGANYFDSHMVEETEFPQADRTQDEQTAYSEWSDVYWSQWHARPSQTISESRVYLATMNNLTEIGEFPRELLRDVQVDSVWDDREKAYLVTASIGKDIYYAAPKSGDSISLFDVYADNWLDGDSLCFQFWLGPYGTYLGIYDVNAPENRAEITLEDGRVIAEKALRVRLNADDETLSGMTLRMSYGEGSEYNLDEGRFNAVCTYMWDDANGTAVYFVELDAKTGLVLEAFDWRESEAMRVNVNAWMTELKGLVENAGVSATLENAQGQYIWYWSLSERAEWSRIARPIVQAYLAEHADFAAYLEDVRAGWLGSLHQWPNLIALTQYVYGVPNGASVSREQAFAAVRDAAIAAGAKQTDIDDSPRHSVYYDVTDPNQPLWKVHLNITFGADDVAHPYDPTAPWGYFAIMDAHTGEILHFSVCTVNTENMDIV